MRLIHFCLILFFICVLGIVSSCKRHFTPKPRGYPRLNVPVHSYTHYKTSCPFTFEYPVYAIIKRDSSRNAEPCWLNIEYPSFKAEVYLSYKTVNNNLVTLMEDSRTFVYNHVSMADAIDEKIISHPAHKVFGIMYDLKGNAASSFQFFATDSLHHFIRASLYFNSRPNYDSLAPIIAYIRQDMVHMVETLEWSKSRYENQSKQ
jgi:gliding motility-associated lipoprotein GldD